MKINYVKIENFKSIENLKVKFDSKFNLLIGKNNIGKTTIFEAILLWAKCYEVNIQQSKKKFFYSNSKNIAFSEIKALRVSEEVDLFNKLKQGKGIIKIIVEIQDEDDTYELGFEITNLVQQKKTYLQVSYINKDEFKRFQQLTNKYSKMLNELIVVLRSKPVANIARKEPYMYKDQILSKISRGKSIEVLRNKIIALKERKEIVEKNISKVIGEEIKFIEEGNKKEYINLKVKKEDEKVDILSQGSGFLQLVEIFTTIEYQKGTLKILLIDEPDAHLHAELQMSLVKTLKENENSQIFIISHNDRFLRNIQEENIVFINKKDKKGGEIKPLKEGSKYLVLENLVDNINEIEELQYINKLVWLEGKCDIKYISTLYDKFVSLKVENKKNIKFNELKGIDDISIKLTTISNVYNPFIDSNIQWIIIRDRDLIPINKINKAKKEIESYVYYENKKVLFHEGYELYSTLFSDTEKLRELIEQYYGVEVLAEDINNTLEGYMRAIFSNISQINKKMEINFKRQKDKRKGIYRDIDFRDYLESLNANKEKIEFIMEKSLIDKFLNEIAEKFNKRNKSKLTKEVLFDFYLGKIDKIEDFYKCHLEIMDAIYA